MSDKAPTAQALAEKILDYLSDLEVKKIHIDEAEDGLTALIEAHQDENTEALKQTIIEKLDIIIAKDKRIKELENGQEDWNKGVSLIASACKLETLSCVNISQHILELSSQLADANAKIQELIERNKRDNDGYRSTYRKLKDDIKRLREALEKVRIWKKRPADFVERKVERDFRAGYNSATEHLREIARTVLEDVKSENDKC